jgi:hypothetical protein
LTLWVPKSIARGYCEGSPVVGKAKRRLRNDAGAKSLISCFRICEQVWKTSRARQISVLQYGHARLNARRGDHRSVQELGG